MTTIEAIASVVTGKVPLTWKAMEDNTRAIRLSPDTEALIQDIERLTMTTSDGLGAIVRDVIEKTGNDDVQPRGEARRTAQDLMRRVWIIILTETQPGLLAEGVRKARETMRITR